MNSAFILWVQYSTTISDAIFSPTEAGRGFCTVEYGPTVNHVLNEHLTVIFFLHCNWTWKACAQFITDVMSHQANLTQKYIFHESTLHHESHKVAIPNHQKWKSDCVLFGTLKKKICPTKCAESEPKFEISKLVNNFIFWKISKFPKWIFVPNLNHH